MRRELSLTDELHPAVADWAGLLLDQNLEIVAAQFASRVRFAVDERTFSSQHFDRVTVARGIIPSNVRGNRPIACENPVSVGALFAGGDVLAEMLRRRPDGIGQAAVGSPAADWKCFQDDVER